MFCPEGMREGSDCYAENWVSHPLWLVSFGAGLSAMLVVLVAAILAPKNKQKISIGAYIAGAIVASSFTVFIGQISVPYVVALVAGLLALLVVMRLTSGSWLGTRNKLLAP